MAAVAELIKIGGGLLLSHGLTKSFFLFGQLLLLLILCPAGGIDLCGLLVELCPIGILLLLGYTQLLCLLLQLCGIGGLFLTTPCGLAVKLPLLLLLELMQLLCLLPQLGCLCFLGGTGCFQTARLLL